LITALRYP